MVYSRHNRIQRESLALRDGSTKMLKVNLFRDGERSRGDWAIGAVCTQHHEAARERTGNMRRVGNVQRSSSKSVTPHAYRDNPGFRSFGECQACPCMQSLGGQKAMRDEPAHGVLWSNFVPARGTGTSHPFEVERHETSQRLPSPVVGPASLTRRQ
jgi:hypothetical protein